MGVRERSREDLGEVRRSVGVRGRGGGELERLREAWRASRGGGPRARGLQTGKSGLRAGDGEEEGAGLWGRRMWENARLSSDSDDDSGREEGVGKRGGGIARSKEAGGGARWSWGGGGVRFGGGGGSVARGVEKVVSRVGRMAGQEGGALGGELRVRVIRNMKAACDILYGDDD